MGRNPHESGRLLIVMFQKNAVCKSGLHSLFFLCNAQIYGATELLLFIIIFHICHYIFTKL
jgi:hypothetical protein